MKVKIKLNQNLSTPKGKPLKNQEISIDCSPESIPLDRFWRRRFTDAKIDHCLKILDIPLKNGEMAINGIVIDPKLKKR